VTGEEGVYIVYPMEGTRNCYEPGHFLTLSWCLVNHYWPPSPSVAREKSLDIPLEQEDVCFMVKTPRANSEHSLHVRGKREIILLLLLVIAVNLPVWSKVQNEY
jgi:hypothetical protein